MNRRQILIQAIFPVLAFWLVLLGLAFLLDADWPNGRVAKLNQGSIGWQTFFLAMLVITVFLMKARIALWNRRSDDWFAISFSALDITIALFFTYLTFTNLWPGWRFQNGTVYREIFQGLEVGIAVTSIWFLYMFVDAIVSGRFVDRREDESDVQSPPDVWGEIGHAHHEE